MSFRKKKQRELFRKAEIAVSQFNSLYPLYVLKNWSSQIAIFSFGATFWLVAGSLVYEFFESIPVEDSTYITDYYGGDGSYETAPMDSNGIHHVEPHWVDGYERSDGTTVEGYWRGGEDGYYRSNPDGNPFNNLRP